MICSRGAECNRICKSWKASSLSTLWQNDVIDRMLQSIGRCHKRSIDQMSIDLSIIKRIKGSSILAIGPSIGGDIRSIHYNDQFDQRTRHRILLLLFFWLFVNFLALCFKFFKCFIRKPIFINYLKWNCFRIVILSKALINFKLI